jgi:hypothetical protein
MSRVFGGFCIPHLACLSVSSSSPGLRPAHQSTGSARPLLLLSSESRTTASTWQQLTTWSALMALTRLLQRVAMDGLETSSLVCLRSLPPHSSKVSYAALRSLYKSKSNLFRYRRQKSPGRRIYHSILHILHTRYRGLRYLLEGAGLAKALPLCPAAF